MLKKLFNAVKKVALAGMAVVGLGSVAAHAETPTSLTELLATVDFSSLETFTYASAVIMIAISLTIFGVRIVKRIQR